jgi:predicted AlkP superfamily pyrophosphatase or phosphodiesterase
VGVILPAIAVLAASLALAGAVPASAELPQTVILISLDGTRPDDLREDDLPTLTALARGGARAEALVPVLPTNTFPNHVTLVTGVAPERHGLVNNQFVDPERGDFERKDIPSWIEVEPIWSWLAGRGVVSASYYWVGSEGPWRSGRGPRHWVPFDASTPESEKVEQILAWLDLDDPEERPRLVTSWFHGADRAAHRNGPGSEAARQALQSQDRAIAQLIRGLEERGLRRSTALLFVSDHGMAPLGRKVDLRKALARDGLGARVLGAGGFVQIYLDQPERDGERAVEVARGLGLEAHLRTSAPPDWRVGHPRFGDVVVLAPISITIQSSRFLSLPTRGWHGYRPDEPSMAGILVASGPGIQPGTRLGRVATLDVAPTVIALLGETPPEWMEGRVIGRLLEEGPAVVGGEDVEEGATEP